MTALKRIALFYFIIAGVGTLLILLLSGNLEHAVQDIPFWVLPLAFSLLGWLIGVVIYELMVRPQQKKNRIFLISHIVATTGFATILVLTRLDDINEQKNANSRENASTMKWFVNDNEEYIRTGFKRLESEFGNPNDLKLDAFSVRKRDTVIGNTRDTLYTVYYAYYLRDKKELHFSKLAMWQNKPELLIFNQSTKSNEEYKIIQAEKDKNEQEVIRMTKEAFDLVDSINKKKR